MTSKKETIKALREIIANALPQYEIDIKVDEYCDYLTWYIDGIEHIQSIAGDSQAAIIVDMSKTVEKILWGQL